MLSQYLKIFDQPILKSHHSMERLGPWGLFNMDVLKCPEQIFFFEVGAICKMYDFMEASKSTVNVSRSFRCHRDTAPSLPLYSKYYTQSRTVSRGFQALL